MGGYQPEGPRFLPGDKQREGGEDYFYFRLPVEKPGESVPVIELYLEDSD
jgi:hypothetical protein